MAGYAHLTIDAGSTFSKELSLTNPDGSPIDLTGYTLAGSMRRSFYSNANVQAFTLTITDPPTLGKIVISLSAAQTANLRPGRYVYTIDYDLNGGVDRLLKGIITVEPSARINYAGATGI